MSINDPDDDIPDLPMSEALREEPDAKAEERLKEEGEEPGEPMSPVGTNPPRREFMSIALGVRSWRRPP